MCAAATATTPAPSTPSRPRLDALDRLRGIALVAMLLHHFVGWLTGGDARAVLPGWPGYTITDTAAPAFFVAAGMSAALFVARQRRHGLANLRIGAQLARRYGLLVPIGMALRWALWRSPFGFGVLEALGVAVLAAAAILAIVPARLRWCAAGTVVVVGMLAERATTGHHDWVAVQLVGGKFPVVTYIGFALVGMTAVRTGRHVDRRWVATAALVAILAAMALLADGIAPDRYPGELPFVVPGLTGTVLAYAVGQYRWPQLLAPVDWILRRAAIHTLGIFLFHYATYAILQHWSIDGSVSHMVAVPLAVAITVALCVAAPFVPQAPWSLRTGRSHRTRSSTTRDRSALTVRRAVMPGTPPEARGGPDMREALDAPEGPDADGVTAGKATHRATGEAPLGSP